MRSLAILVGMATTSLSGLALANPIVVLNEVYVEQFIATSHVQVTRNFSAGGPTETTVTRDGAPLRLTFESFAGGSRDLGSGMSEVTTVVACDCSVPLGHHAYIVAGNTVELDLVDAKAAMGTVRQPSADCRKRCPAVSKDQTASPGCSVSRAAGGSLPMGVLAALSLLAFRRRK